MGASSDALDLWPGGEAVWAIFMHSTSFVSGIMDNHYLVPSRFGSGPAMEPGKDELTTQSFLR